MKAARVLSHRCLAWLAWVTLVAAPRPLPALPVHWGRRGHCLLQAAVLRGG